MSLDLNTRTTQRWIHIGVLLAILSLGSLEGLKALHHLGEDPCQGELTGDPCTCFLCSHFTYLSGDLTVVPTIAPPTVSAILIPSPSPEQPDAPIVLPSTARSPPTAA